MVQRGGGHLPPFCSMHITHGKLFFSSKYLNSHIGKKVDFFLERICEPDDSKTREMF